MGEALFEYSLGAIRPVDEVAKAFCRDCQERQPLRLTLPRRPRNGARHRYYWKLLSVVIENTDKWPSADALHDSLKLALGIVKQAMTIDGEIIFIPDSTAFDRMSEEQFVVYLDRAVEVICSKIIPGLDPMTLRMEAQARAA